MEATARNENNAPAAEMTDPELNDVTGGNLYKWHDEATGKYYKWTGALDNGLKYLCPNCRRPLSSFWGIKYTCDHCDASWVFEYRLLPNYASGLWKEITKAEYDDRDEDYR